MITLKAALIVASAVGAVAVGGGVSWAMVGAHQDAGLQSENSKAVPVHDLKGAAPSTTPTCLPTKPALPKPALPHGRLPDAKVPGTKVPDAKVPDAKLPQGKVPDTGAVKPDLPQGAPKIAAPQPGVPGKPGVPADLPTCLPNAKQLPQGGLPKTPSVPIPAKPALPALPALPAVPAADCGTLPPAVKIGGPAEKAIILTKGLRYVSTSHGSPTLEKKRICAIAQKWTGSAGQWLTVERLKTPKGLTQNELRKALALPEGGTPVTVPGAAGRQGLDGAGVLLFDPDGYSLFVNGSSVLAGSLQDVATALRQAR